MAGMGAMAAVVAAAETSSRPQAESGRAGTNRKAINIEEIVMLNIKLVSWTLGLWGAVTFIVCLIYGLVTPQSLHMHEFLEQVLPAFKWLTWWGFLLGLAESFLYGVYAGMVYVPIYNALKRRWAEG